MTLEYVVYKGIILIPIVLIYYGYLKYKQKQEQTKNALIDDYTNLYKRYLEVYDHLENTLITKFPDNTAALENFRYTHLQALTLYPATINTVYKLKQVKAVYNDLKELIKTYEDYYKKEIEPKL